MSVKNTSEDTGGTTETTRSEGLLSELRIDHETLPLMPALSGHPELRVNPEYQTVVDNETVLVFTVRGNSESFDSFEQQLEMDPTVAGIERIDTYPQRQVYRATITPHATRYRPMTMRSGSRILSQTGTHSGWELRLRLPNRDALQQFNARCSEQDVSVHVRTLCHAADESERIPGLTERQQRLICLAYEEGYFDLPRGISQEGLADRLGVSKSAISQRTRRAIKAICRETLPNLEADDPSEYNQA